MACASTGGVTGLICVDEFVIVGLCAAFVPDVEGPLSKGGESGRSVVTRQVVVDDASDEVDALSLCNAFAI